MVQTRGGTITKPPESRPKIQNQPPPSNLASKTISVPVADLGAHLMKEKKDSGLVQRRVQPAIMERLQESLAKSLAPEKGDLNKEGPAYRTQAPVEAEIDVNAITELILNGPFTLSLRDIAGLAPKVREHLRAQFSKARVPPDKATLLAEVQEAGSETEPKPIDVTSLTFPSYCVAVEGEGGAAPVGAMVAGDPVLTYFNEVPREEANELVVAKETCALRTIYPRINNITQDECILDDGSQIIAMSEKVAHELGLTWDPEVTLRVESANKSVERSLGLARNVLFDCGGVHLYLQVHIIRDPAYRILLGRPFSVLGQTSVKTKLDGDTTVHVTDPNNGRQAVIPTYARGQNPDTLQKQKNDPAFASASRT